MADKGLNLAERTVKTYRARAIEKLGLLPAGAEITAYVGGKEIEAGGLAAKMSDYRRLVLT